MASNEWDSIGTPVSSSDDWSAVGTPVGDSNKKQNKGIKADVAAGKMTREDAIKQLKAMGYK